MMASSTKLTFMYILNGPARLMLSSGFEPFLRRDATHHIGWIVEGKDGGVSKEDDELEKEPLVSR